MQIRVQTRKEENLFQEQLRLSPTDLSSMKFSERITTEFVTNHLYTATSAYLQFSDPSISRLMFVLWAKDKLSQEMQF